MTPVRRVRETVRSSLWPIPVAAVLLALVLGVLVPRLDRAVDTSLPSWVRSLLFSGGPDAARTVLDAVSSSLITVTSLTFSLTVVTLQLASSQFSPRLLRTFTSDLFVQVTLGLFLATFTFSLTALRSVRTADDTQSAFVPRISVTLAFVLAVAGVLGLVVFLAHLARQIRVETMLREVHADASDTIEAVLEPRGAADGAVLTPPADARVLLAAASGFLIEVDADALLRVAVEHDVQLVLDRPPGSSLVHGTPLGRVWPAPGRSAEFDRAIADAVGIGYERTAAQDVAYGLRQLTDVANKALSPSVNDPTTGVHALGHISAVLCELAGRRLGPVVLHDADDRPRVGLDRPDLATLVDAAISQPRRYAAAEPEVLIRVLQLLEELTWHLPPTEHALVRSQLDRTVATVAAGDFDSVEADQLGRAADRVRNRSHPLERKQPMRLLDPVLNDLTPHHLETYWRFQVVRTLVDFGAAICFVIGSAFFFFTATTIAADWLFLIGSILFAAKPTIDVVRSARLKRLPGQADSRVR